MSEQPIYGLVLSGGESKRMGRDKALLRHDGQSQLAFVVALLERHVERVLVSTRAEQKDEAERSRFDQVIDHYTDMGPLAGILSAMDDYPEADWLVVACDLPNIGDETLRHLLENRSPAHPFSAYISSHDGLPEPLCAVYRASSAPLVRQFADDGIRCPRKILIRSDTYLLEQLDPTSLDNVNTPVDLGNSVLEATS
ncbi:MAG: molybdenum cofactor guanylyltransferase [Gammaproteobacteria bacterium]|nr:molybdenum cofactor guanylyltransferase [Gammaproteobacteria bacterium]MDH5617039.1 molybdenum cofactor guanylyltransferase [Gammaproteobacteria bacterium]